MQLHGLHHVTAVTARVQDNLRFYTTCFTRIKSARPERT
jgi:catechol 2,3-dioxygenase-like lactoylglutathione lyase family enzyme